MLFHKQRQRLSLCLYYAMLLLNFGTRFGMSFVAQENHCDTEKRHQNQEDLCTIHPSHRGDTIVPPKLAAIHEEYDSGDEIDSDDYFPYDDSSDDYESEDDEIAYDPENEPDEDICRRNPTWNNKDLLQEGKSETDDGWIDRSKVMYLARSLWGVVRLLVLWIGCYCICLLLNCRIATL